MSHELAGIVVVVVVVVVVLLLSRLGRSNHSRERLNERPNELTVVFMPLSNTATIPTKAHDNDAGWDLYASEIVTVPPGQTRLVSTGLAVAIEPGWCGVVKERSGLALKKEVSVHGGVIDSGYRDSIGVIVRNASASLPFTVMPGDRIAQMLFVPVPDVEWTPADELDPSDRAFGGFGSTGS